MQLIARVFPRRTKATPDDWHVYTDGPPLWVTEGSYHEVHISVTFSYDMEKAKRMADDWLRIGEVKIGGPATGDPGGDFEPGMYLRKGYVITSRGCPNNCWFCDVPKREGPIRELKIHDGWNILDANLLACSDGHVRRVFQMLRRSPKPVEFTGGLEAKILKPWHVSELWDLRPSQMFFAFDTPDDEEPLRNAGKMLRYADFTRRHMRCYVLIGWPKDTMEDAERRLMLAWEFGFMPMAMLYKDKNGSADPEWKKFQRTWGRPAIIRSMIQQAVRDAN